MTRKVAMVSKTCHASFVSFSIRHENSGYNFTNDCIGLLHSILIAVVVNVMVSMTCSFYHDELLEYHNHHYHISQWGQMVHNPIMMKVHQLMDKEPLTVEWGLPWWTINKGQGGISIFQIDQIILYGADLIKQLEVCPQIQIWFTS